MSSVAPTGELWFLTGSQHLYGPEVLDQVELQSREIAKLLDDSPQLSFDVVWKPVLTDPPAIVDIVRQANAEARCIGVIAWMHTFSPAKMWIVGLDELRKPLLHLHTQLNRELPWQTIDMDFMNLNQAAHGDREFGFVQTRLGVARKTVAGHVTDEKVAERIDDWARAAAGAAHLRTLRLARFGDNMRDVAVTEGDKVEAQLRFGVSVNTYGLTDIVDVVDSAGDDAVDEVVDDYLASYQVVPDLRRDGARHDALRYAARIEVGLSSFLTDGGFGAFTTNFEDLGGLRQLPGIAVQRLMQRGYGFGAEGDWKSAVLLAAVKQMGAGRTRGTSFMEDYSYHFGPGTGKILGAHMLEVCPSIAADRPTCEIHPLSMGNRDDPVRLVFDATPGAGVVVGMCDMGDRFRLVANAIDVVPPDEPLPRLPVARAVWVPQPDLPTAAEAWLMAGGPHHTVLTQSVGMATLRDFAAMTRTELAVIDARTDTYEFADRLRWNQAYYRVAEGLGRRP
ncbi:MAG TPA: L-arabinose isomerase [Jatrophihabitantaceae bacterium]